RDAPAGDDRAGSAHSARGRWRPQPRQRSEPGVKVSCKGHARRTAQDFNRIERPRDSICIRCRQRYAMVMASADLATPPNRSSFRALAVVAFVVLVALAVGRDHPLQNLNEGVYARVAQEMLERRDFIVPMLDGVPYLEKPPLLYWITAAAFAAFGPGEAV